MDYNHLHRGDVYATHGMGTLLVRYLISTVVTA